MILPLGLDWFGAGVALFVSMTGLERHVIAPAVDRRLDLLDLTPALRRGLERMESRDDRAALRELTRAAKESPRDPELCQLLAQCRFYLGAPERARESLHRGLRIHLERRDHPMIMEAYFELLRSRWDVRLDTKETYFLSTALRIEGYVDEAAKRQPSARRNQMA